MIQNNTEHHQTNKPEILNWEFNIRDLKEWDLEFCTWDLEFYHLGFNTWDLNDGIWNFIIWDFKEWI